MAPVAEDGARIVTPRLVLRRPRPDDLAGLHVIMKDPRVMRYWSTPEHETLDQTRAYLDRLMETPEGDEFILEHDGQVAGKAGAWRAGEIGYLLDARLWGQGLAREALEALIPWLFAHHDWPELTAEIDPRNLASQRLLERLGFRVTHAASRTLLWRDEWCDSLYLALPRPAA